MNAVTSAPFIVQEEEDQIHSATSKAAQKRARKKAASAAPAAAAEGGQQQRPLGFPADAQDLSEPSVGVATAKLQQLHHDAPAAVAAGSAIAAPSKSQPTHSWMLCPLTKVGSRLYCQCRQSLFAVCSRGQMSCCVHAGGPGRPCAVQRLPHIQPSCHYNMAGCQWCHLTTDQPTAYQP